MKTYRTNVLLFSPSHSHVENSQNRSVSQPNMHLHAALSTSDSCFATRGRLSWGSFVYARRLGQASPSGTHPCSLLHLRGGVPGRASSFEGRGPVSWRNLVYARRLGQASRTSSCDSLCVMSSSAEGSVDRSCSFDQASVPSMSCWLAALEERCRARAGSNDDEEHCRNKHAQNDSDGLQRVRGGSEVRVEEEEELFTGYRHSQGDAGQRRSWKASDSVLERQEKVRSDAQVRWRCDN